MRKLLFVCLFFISCEINYEPPKPIFAYYSEIKVSSTTGKVISSEVTSDFLFENDAINKCLNAAAKGIIHEVDSVNHITTIKVTTWIYPDSKSN